jgi:hypothetical protein
VQRIFGGCCQLGLEVGIGTIDFDYFVRHLKPQIKTDEHG